MVGGCCRLRSSCKRMGYGRSVLSRYCLRAPLSKTAPPFAPPQVPKSAVVITVATTCSGSSATLLFTLASGESLRTVFVEDAAEARRRGLFNWGQALNKTCKVMARVGRG